MATLRKLTLDHNERTGRWELTDDRSNRIVKTFATKGAATTGGALWRAVGSDGGSVKIQKQNGRFQEERTYPRSRDPRRSRG